MSGFSLSGPELLALAVAVVLVVVVIGIFLYLARRLRSRRDELLTELKSKPELVQDRAFNRLAMARREAEIVGRTGADTGAAQALIAQSQAAFDLRQFPRAYELAQSAHENLVLLRQRSARTAPLPEGGAPSPPLGSAARAPGTARLPPIASGPPAASPAAPLPKGRAESHFMVGALGRDLEAAAPGAGTTQEARALYTQSQAAFDRGDYTESFRLALRGRRALGRPIETLAPSPRTTVDPATAAAPDPSGAADSLAGATRCPDCGFPIPSGDVFCRGCGRSLTPTTCASCGAPRTAADRFCGRCGATFDR